MAGTGASTRRPVTIAVASIVALGVAALASFSTYQDYALARKKTVETAQLKALSQALFLPARASGVHAPGVGAAVAALDAQPLDSPALALAGFAMSVGDANGRAMPVMTEVLRRDPRSVPARLWLLSAALRKADLAGAVAQLDRIMVIDRYSAEAYFPALADLAKRPHAEAIFTRLFAQNPGWRGAFLEYLTATGQNSAMVFRLAGNAPTEASEVKSRLIQKLLDGGQVDAAYLAWVNFLPESALAQVASVYDGDFAGLVGLRPFNWTFNDSEAASVGMEHGEGLQIDYPAAQSVRMANQTLVLKPGRYRLNYTAHGTADTPDGGVISWRVACLPATTVLLDDPVKGLGDQFSGHAAQFSVPAGCTQQMLSLEGAAGTFPQSRSLSIRHVAIASVAS